MAQVTVYVPDELLDEYRALPPDERPSPSRLTQDGIRDTLRRQRSDDRRAVDAPSDDRREE